MRTFQRLLFSLTTAFLVLTATSFALDETQTERPTCKPVSQRTGELGCWILIDTPVGSFDRAEVYWHVDKFLTRAAAEQVKGPRGTVIDSLGSVWLLTIERKGWRSKSGDRVAEIGPLPIHQSRAYSATFMEAIFTPGMTSAVHTHSGPEAWYTVAGESCLETSQGTFYGKAGGPPMIVPEGPAMKLTATGTQTRKALVLILHDSSKPATAMEHDWKPKGLCKVASSE